MEHDNRDYPAAYAPIPKGIIKDEPEEEPNLEEIQEECREQVHGEPLMAYRPLPHGVIKVELQSGDDGHDTQPSSDVRVENKDQDGTIADQENIEHREYSVTHPSIVNGVVKEEPISDGDVDDNGCELVAYAPLRHGVIKEELEVVDGRDEIISGVQIGQQERNKNPINEAADDAPIIEHVAETPVYENGAGEPGTSRRKRTEKGNISSGTIPGSRRILRSRSKGKITVKNVNEANQRETEELAMEECDAGEKKQQNSDQYDERSEHSSIDAVSSTDDEGDPNQPLTGSAPRKKKSAKKITGKAGHSQENEKLPFKCEDCGRAFKVERYLRKHLARTCRIEPQIKFPCKECGHQFKRKDDLRKHLMRTHNVEKSQLALFGAGPMIRPVFPFKCHKCDKTYKHKGSLTQHLKYGCDLDPSFPCTLCDYRASRKSSLRDHLMVIHSVDRSEFTGLGAAAPKARPVQPFKCEKCGRCYKLKYNLTQHLKYECGVDPLFLCTQCDYRASQKSNLKQHLINVHAGAGLPQLE